MSGQRIAWFHILLRQLRLERRWSQEELAARANLNRSYFGEIERGQAMPSLATPEKLSAEIELSLTELMSRYEQGGRRAPALPRIDG